MKQFFYLVALFGSAFFLPVVLVYGGLSLWRTDSWTRRLFRPPFGRPSRYDYPYLGSRH